MHGTSISFLRLASRAQIAIWRSPCRITWGFSTRIPRLAMILSIKINLSLCIAMLCRSGIDGPTDRRAGRPPSHSRWSAAARTGRSAAPRQSHAATTNASGLASVATLERTTRTMRGRMRRPPRSSSAGDRRTSHGQGPSPCRPSPRQTPPASQRRTTAARRCRLPRAAIAPDRPGRPGAITDVQRPARRAAGSPRIAPAATGSARRAAHGRRRRPTAPAPSPWPAADRRPGESPG